MKGQKRLINIKHTNDTCSADMRISQFNIINYQRKQKAFTALAVCDKATPNDVSLLVPDQNLEVTTINENWLVVGAKGGRPKGATIENRETLTLQ